MDPFEKYISTHKHKFEDEFEPEEVWNRISFDLKNFRYSRNRLSPKKTLLAAACTILFLISGFLIVQNRLEDNVLTVQKKSSNGTYPPRIKSEEAKKIENKTITTATIAVKKVAKNGKPLRKNNDYQIQKHQNTELDIQLQTINATPIYTGSPEYFDLFIKQFAELNELESLLRIEAKNDGLLMLYQKKRFLLNELQLEISKMNNRVLKTPDAASKSPYFINI